MKHFLLLTVMCVSVLCLSVTVQSQTIDCAYVDSLRAENTFEEVQIVDFMGQPGNHALLPVRITNEFPLAGIRIMIEFDPDMVVPVRRYDSITNAQGELVGIDSNFVVCDRMGRMSSPSDPDFVPYAHSNEGRPNAVVCTVLPPLDNPSCVLPPGSDVCIGVHFRVKSEMGHLEVAQFGFFQQELMEIDTTVQPHDTTYFNGCDCSDAVRQVGEVFEAVYPHLVEGTMTADYLTCCQGSVGNVDGSPDELVTMGDLTVLIDYLFISLSPLRCRAEGNVDLSPDRLVTMGDLTALIDYIFINPRPLPPCPF